MKMFFIGACLLLSLALSSCTYIYVNTIKTGGDITIDATVDKEQAVEVPML